MIAKRWKTRLKAACVEAGTYQPFFADVISALSDILEQRDNAYVQFLDSGGEVITTHTNQGGNANPTKNPSLVVWNELNKTALTYWKELGLTPAGLKKINEEILKPRKKSTLTEALKDLG